MVEYQKHNNELGSSGPGARAAPSRPADRLKKSSMQPTDNDTCRQKAPDEWAATLEAVAKSQDRAAFTRLFKHFGPKIKAFGMALNSGYTSEAMADELVQDVMIKVWVKAPSFNPGKASASTWIFTIARNCRIDFLRKMKRIDSPLRAEDLWPAAEEPEPIAVLSQNRDAVEVARAMDTLSVEQRDVLQEIYMKGKTHSEVAEETGLPLGTVKSRVRLAMNKMRKTMA